MELGRFTSEWEKKKEEVEQRTEVKRFKTPHDFLYNECLRRNEKKVSALSGVVR